MTPEALAQTHAAAFTESRPWSPQEFSSLLDSTGVILRGDARSFLLGRIIAGEAEVLTVATAPEFRRQGLAKACIAAFLDDLRAHQATLVFLEVAEDNEPAKALYLNEGFQIIASRANYYTRPSGEKVAACVMQYDFVS